MTAPLRASHPTVVNVVLGERSYEIIIGRGQLASLGEKIAALRPGAKAAIVTDETVARHHLAATEAALAAAGIGTTSVTVPAGETSKSFPVLERVCEALISARIERADVVVALGGGVIGDLAGFAAAVVRRQLACTARHRNTDNAAASCGLAISAASTVIALGVLAAIASRAPGARHDCSAKPMGRNRRDQSFSGRRGR